ncbi:hypothetical protein JTE90_002028 [Oedothorax gibbosus]|uniref:Uncharacterized protein n=1 Tax=Oedothorax gibbosus TaxID=931172 RepID=A0AAV6UNJ6_9ARAC|nr:hypothetical protein JTE90_002028 [Oedothorax gibbosus]
MLGAIETPKNHRVSILSLDMTADVTPCDIKTSYLGMLPEECLGSRDILKENQISCGARERLTLRFISTL